MAEDSHEINLVMQPGTPILQHRHGAWCPFCGDYSRHDSGFGALKTATEGCQRCDKDGEELKMRKVNGKH